MNSSTLVSAIITTYKRDAKIVERALLSIINQSYHNIETIIINDCPEEKQLAKEIKAMIEAHSDNTIIKYIEMEQNGGACKARNTGFKIARGKYIAFLDDDDEWLPEKIKMQIDSMQNNKCAISYCNALFFDMEKDKTSPRFKDIQPSGDIYDRLLEKNLIGSCSFPLIRKEALNEVGGFDEKMPAMQDWELYLRICKKHAVTYIDKPLVRYYKYSGERISRNPSKRVAAFEIMRKKYLKEISKNKQALYNFYLMAANDYSIWKKIPTAIRYYTKAIVIRPLNVKNNFFFICKILARSIVNINKM